jgi:hypothetical protein
VERRFETQLINHKPGMINQFFGWVRFIIVVSVTFGQFCRLHLAYFIDIQLRLLDVIWAAGSLAVFYIGRIQTDSHQYQYLACSLYWFSISIYNWWCVAALKKYFIALQLTMVKQVLHAAVTVAKTQWRLKLWLNSGDTVTTSNWSHRLFKFRSANDHHVTTDCIPMQSMLVSSSHTFCDRIDPPPQISCNIDLSCPIIKQPNPEVALSSHYRAYAFWL